ncbi:hypothetical protein JCM10020v2_001770 [Rhodotorula toruloides]
MAGDDSGGGGTVVYRTQSSHGRSNSAGRDAGRRQYGSQPENVPPPVPSYNTGPPIDFTSAPVSPDVAQYVNTPPDIAPPRDFDPNDSRSRYASNYSPNYMTPDQQRRHETQYIPTNPRMTRQRSISGGPPAHERKTSLIPIAPVPPRQATGGLGVSYGDQYRSEKASTVDLVERDDSFERRSTSVKKGGATVSKGEISDLQQAVREANGSIQAIGDLHSRMLSMPSSEDAMAIELKSQLDSTTATTRALFTSLKNRLQVLQQGNANLRAMIPLGQSLYNLSLQDIDVREQQVGALKERFKDAIQRYTEEEKQNRAKQRARLERQVKVVNPNLDPAELQEIVKKAEEGDGAMFTQALQTNNYRSHAARGALREVQNRAAELARIEQTIIELAQLFQDMAVMVEAQDVAIVKIEQNAVLAETDMENGLENVQKAVVHARNYRKYRWWCFGFIVVIIIIVLVVLCVELIPPAIRAAQNDRNARQSRSSASAARAAATSPAVHRASLDERRIGFVQLHGVGGGAILIKSSIRLSYSVVHKLVLSEQSHPSDGLPRPTPQLPESMLEMLSMKGKVSIVTGGSGGIGFAAAEGLAEMGGDIALAYRSAEGMDKRAEDLAKKFGVKVKAYKCDVADYDEVTKLVNDVKSDFGRVDVFIANGGSGRIKDLSLEQWRKIQAVNYDSVFYAMKAVGPIFEAQGSGSFIATTSISAHIVNVPLDQSAYNASKAAVVHLCKSVARDWRLFARVNTISPGFFDTAMGAAPEVADTVYRYAVLGRQGDPKELKGAFLLLASQAGSFITGSDYLVDGGYTLS